MGSSPHVFQLIAAKIQKAQAEEDPTAFFLLVPKDEKDVVNSKCDLDGLAKNVSRACRQAMRCMSSIALRNSIEVSLGPKTKKDKQALLDEALACPTLYKLLRASWFINLEMKTAATPELFVSKVLPHVRDRDAAIAVLRDEVLCEVASAEFKRTLAAIVDQAENKSEQVAKKARAVVEAALKIGGNQLEKALPHNYVHF